MVISSFVKYTSLKRLVSPYTYWLGPIYEFVYNKRPVKNIFLEKKFSLISMLQEFGYNEYEQIFTARKRSLRRLCFYRCLSAGFPLGLENLEKWKGIFQSGNFEQTGKVRENHTKYWKTQGIWIKYYLIFLMTFKLTVYYLLKWIKFSV